MRWEYRTPSPQQIVSDGQSLWVYTPDLNQVNVGEAPRALAGPAGSFLAGLGKVSEEFSVRFLNPAAPTDRAGNPVLDLTPKRPTPVLTRLILTVDAKDFLVRKAVLYDQFDNTVTMLFTGVTPNPGLADRLFTFTPPKGVAVVPLEPMR
jgi:outer membrane lipoprotein carrier protein